MANSLQLVTAGRTALSRLIEAQPVYLAWGDLSTTTPWTVNDTPPVFDVNQSALEHELGRMAATEQGFVTPDAAGLIQADDGTRYTRVDTPTAYFYARFHFPIDAASSSTIYQIGAFMFTVKQAASLAEQTASVNHTQGYAAGTTAIQLDSFSGSETEIDPSPNAPTPYKRTVTINGHDYKVVSYDIFSKILTLNTGLVAILSDNTSVLFPAVTGPAATDIYLDNPVDIQDPGLLVWASNILPIIRDPATRVQQEIIIPL